MDCIALIIHSMIVARSLTAIAFDIAAQRSNRLKDLCRELLVVDLESEPGLERHREADHGEGVEFRYAAEQGRRRTNDPGWIREPQRLDDDVLDLVKRGGDVVHIGSIP